MKTTYYIFLLLICTLTLNAQEPGYVIIKNNYMQGIIYLQGGMIDMQSCKFKKHKKSGLQNLLPNEIAEYGLRDGKTSYKSFEITINEKSKLVFLKQITLDSINYYYYKEKGLKMFFIERDSVITEIPQAEFNIASKKQKRVNHSNFIKTINVSVHLGLRNGNLKDFSHVKSSYIMYDDLIVKNTGTNVAVYISIPTQERFEFQTGLVLARGRFENNKGSININSDFYSFNLPLKVMFNNRNKVVSPVFGLGAVYCYRSFNENIFQYNNTIHTLNLLNKNTFCLTFSVGLRMDKVLVEYQLNNYEEDNLKYNEHVLSLGYIF